MLLPVLVWCAFALALLPALLFLRNLTLYKPPPPSSKIASVSILIPARNEEKSIEACLRAALISEGVSQEILVLDDHSQDQTAAIVRRIADRDSRVRLLSAPALPDGWCGKQFACSVLAEHARNPILCFLDADVQLTPAGLARMIAAMRQTQASIISGFPRQITRTPMEQLLLPLMHFLLLSFLPLDQMRKTLKPSLGAGCGQIFVAERLAYVQTGGHAAIKHSRHDGLMLPRAFRRAGFKTDLCDATQVASCRMYASTSEVFHGLLKNATEGIASPRLILIWSFLLITGQILPAPLFAYACIYTQSKLLCLCSLAALIASLLPRIVAVFRFKQPPLLAALLHPVAILVFLCIQWLAFARVALRIPTTWKGRTYSEA